MSNSSVAIQATARPYSKDVLLQLYIIDVDTWCRPSLSIYMNKEFDFAGA